uniref:Uncharacterized protein n=1 Tax=Metamycoplasma arthritidis TaxID=2111 RepID=Q84IB0_METAT|nr:unknown [Metamycoplasma arthritidis]
MTIATTTISNRKARLLKKLVPQAVPKKIILRAEREFNEWQDSQELEQKEIFNKSAFLDSLKKKHLVTWLMCIYGSNILFATPIIMGVYPQGIQLGALNIWNILYYVGGFGLAYTLISGVRFTKKEFKFTLKKALLNPSLLAILGALILWSSQYIPGAGSTIRDLPLTGEGAKSGTVLIGNQEVVKTFSQVGTFGPNFSKIYAYTYADGKVQWVVWDSIKQLYVPYQGKPTGWFDLNVTMPYLAKPISILASLVSPLIWIVIGTSGNLASGTSLSAWLISASNFCALSLSLASFSCNSFSLVLASSKASLARLIVVSNSLAKVFTSGSFLSSAKYPSPKGIKRSKSLITWLKSRTLLAFLAFLMVILRASRIFQASFLRFCLWLSRMASIFFSSSLISWISGFLSLFLDLLVALWWA